MRRPLPLEADNDMEVEQKTMDFINNILVQKKLALIKSPTAAI